MEVTDRDVTAGGVRGGPARTVGCTYHRGRDADASARSRRRGVLREIGVPTEVIDSNGARHMTRHDSETIYGKLGYNA